MSQPIQDLELKQKALESAISYPKLREDNDTWLIEVDNFSYDLISKQIQDHEKLTNFEGAKIDMILEMIKLLSDHKIKYNVELHNYIAFYFKGLPILTIKVNNSENNSVNQGRMVYVSIRTYSDELESYLTDRKLSKVVAGTVGGFLILCGGIFAYSFLKSKTD